MDIEIRAEAVMEGRDYLALTRFMTNGKNKKDREDEITHIAKLCQITELLEKHPYDSSGGEQQIPSVCFLMERY